MFNAQTILALVASLSIAACSRHERDKPSVDARRAVAVETSTPVILEDGVYPVVLPDKDKTKDHPEIQVVELINVPVENSGVSIPEKIRVISRPLVRFQKLSHFDFGFAKNECTEVGFQNTDELKAYTREHIGDRLAVVIGNKVISHHKIREAIEADQVRITCCSVGGGDHLHKHLRELKLASEANTSSN